MADTGCVTVTITAEQKSAILSVVGMAEMFDALARGDIAAASRAVAQQHAACKTFAGLQAEKARRRAAALPEIAPPAPHTARQADGSLGGFNPDFTRIIG